MAFRGTPAEPLLCRCGRCYDVEFVVSMEAQGDLRLKHDLEVPRPQGSLQI